MNKKKAALSSIMAAVFLTLTKFIVGILTFSLGILSEALHSLLDLVAALITYVSVNISDKPADKDHHFGHGKVENLSAFLESILLVVTSVWIIYEAVHRLLANNVTVEISFWSYAVVILSIVIDASRSRMLFKAAKRNRSQALEADAVHFSTDILSSAVVLLGLVFAQMGYHKADSFAAIAVAVIILYISYKLSRKAVDVLLDRVPEGITELVENELRSNPAIRCFHDLKIRSAGSDTFIRVNVHLSSQMDFETTHRVCDDIEQRIGQLIPRCDIVVHAEPE
jgi:cation diffusion facilitator family transporter